MSLNLSTYSPSDLSSSRYNDAVNDARFVRTFGIIALIGSFLIVLGGGVAIGVGLAVMGFGRGRFYRTLGLTVIILGILAFLLEPFKIIASMVLAAGILFKGKTILDVLAAEGKEDPDWQPTRSRAITGMVVSGIAILVGFGWLGLIALALIGQALTA